MTKVRNVECGDRFYDRDYGYVIITDITRTASLGEVVFTLESPAYALPKNRRKAGKVYLDEDNEIEIVGKCVRCQQYKPYAELEYYNGYCNDCVTQANG